MAASRAVRSAITLVKLVGVLVVTGVLAAGLLLPYVGGAGIAASKGADKFLDTKCDLKETALAQSTTIYARDGKTLMATLFTDNRRIIALTSIPKTVQKALIDTEDRRFYEHHGVDTRGLLRAILNESSGGSTQGGSTLTQQYVKQVRFYQADTDAERTAAIQQTGDRKIYEAKCALDLEKKYTKAQILEKYFNIAYFGEQSYGIAVAARNYFGKTPPQLTVPEAAVLVGLVKDPTLYDPFQNPKPARERRDEVIENMVKAGDLTRAQANAYEKTPIKLATTKAPLAAQGCAFANEAAIKNVGFFCDYVVNWLATKGGISEDRLSSGGYKIVTTLNPTLQNTGQQAIFQNFPATSPTTAIMPEIDPANGQVIALLTSKHYSYSDARTKDPRYTSIPVFTKPTSGAGSTFKYFSLIAALTAGVQDFQSLTTAGAFPARYFPKYCGEDTSVASNGIANAGNYRQTLSLRSALVQSSNTFFVGLEDQIFGCNLSTIVKTAQDLGIDSLNLPDDPSKPTGNTVAQATVKGNRYTFTIGQTAVSPLELTSAYSATANDGVLYSPTPVISITGPNNKAVAFKQATHKRVMSQWVARTAIDIMKGDTESGGGGTANGEFSSFYNQFGQNQHLVAAKTGTNNASYQGGPNAGQDNGSNAALWFVGLTPSVVATAALYNIDCPTCTIVIPGYTSTNDVFGAYSAGLWVEALQPYLSGKAWFWQDRFGITGAQQVPSVVGQLPASAVANLKAAGFKPVQYPIPCGGPNIPGTINYSGPQYALPGETVYYCVSNGLSLTSPPVFRTSTPRQPTAQPPAPPPAQPPKPPARRTRGRG